MESKETVYLPNVFISICKLRLLSASNEYEFYKAFLMAEKNSYFLQNYNTGKDVGFFSLKYCHSKNSYWVSGESPDMYLSQSQDWGLCPGLFVCSGVYFLICYASTLPWRDQCWSISQCCKVMFTQTEVCSKILRHHVLLDSFLLYLFYFC